MFAIASLTSDAAMFAFMRKVDLATALSPQRGQRVWVRDTLGVVLAILTISCLSAVPQTQRD